MMDRNIYLIGFMGAGKSTVGRLLARELGRRFIDMDDELEKRFGMSIRDYFSRNGEDEFRKRETDYLRKLSEKKGLVAATGGGLIMKEENRRIAASSGTIVYLEADFETCRNRLGPVETASRPMWKNESEVRALFDKRKKIYEKADMIVSVDGKSPGRAAVEIASRLISDDVFPIEMGGERSTVFSTFNAPVRLAELAGDRRLVVLTDKKVKRLHLDRYLDELNDPIVIEVPGGERIKSLGMARRIYETLLDNHINRDDMLAAVGGGTVTDLGAYVAGTFKRGMRFALVSTTLLGCVDAAVGGKAAVNLGPAKNIVGCFTVPDGVVLDAASLRTLPRGRICEGVVEAYKTGLVADPALAGLIERDIKGLFRKDPGLLFKVVSLSARAKAEVVGGDFKESGRRAILNFGHTYGHAIEGWHNYKVSHGQAVAAGMIVAVEISRNRSLLARAEADKIISTIGDFIDGAPELPPVREAMDIMMHDKKIRRGKLVFVLLERTGEPVIVDDIETGELDRAIRAANEVL